MLLTVKVQSDQRFPLEANDALEGLGCNLGPFRDPELALQRVDKGLVHERGPAQTTWQSCVSYVVLEKEDWRLGRVIIHTLAFDTLFHHHRADADDLVADEISSATTAVDNYESVASLKPK